MLTYHCRVPRSLGRAYSVNLWKWELFFCTWCQNGHFEAQGAIINAPVLFSVINIRLELPVLWLPILGEYLGHWDALIRSFFKNENHLNPQKGQKGPFLGSKWPKMVQNGLFPKMLSVELVVLLELIKMCFSKSGLTHFQPIYDILCPGEANRAGPLRKNVNYLIFCKLSSELFRTQ